MLMIVYFSLSLFAFWNLDIGIASAGLGLLVVAILLIIDLIDHIVK